MKKDAKSLFQTYLARYKKEAEGLDHTQDDPETENDKDNMPIITEASLSLSAEDDDKSDDDDKDKVEASDDSDDDDDDKDGDKVEASDDSDDDDKKDDVVEAVAKQVEAELESVISEVQKIMRKAKVTPTVASAIIEGLQNHGFLIKNPMKVDWSKTKLSAGDKEFVKQVVQAAHESSEDILKAASFTLSKHKKTTKHAAQLDKRLFNDGYMKTRIAEPLILDVRRSDANLNKRK